MPPQMEQVFIVAELDRVLSLRQRPSLLTDLVPVDDRPELAALRNLHF